MLTRRRFLRDGLMAGASVAAIPAFGSLQDDEFQYLTILHTNDTHSRLDPFPMDGSRNQGLGGVAARAALIDKVRGETANVLLLDAGDTFQGTPYFNLYRGEPEIKAMSAMNYDASTIGNHDFDGGNENLANQISSHANFPMIISNYDFSGTPMENKYKPYQTFKRGKLKIGIFGLGIELEGLVPTVLHQNTKYLDPVSTANAVASKLRNEQNCDLVICLSHLGYKYSDNKIDDEKLAKATDNIDVIIGGHTHSFLEAPVTVKSKSGSDVIINQVGFAGILLGRIDLEFSKFSKRKLLNSSSITVTKKSIE